MTVQINQQLMEDLKKVCSVTGKSLEETLEHAIKSYTRPFCEKDGTLTPKPAFYKAGGTEREILEARKNGRQPKITFIPCHILQTEKGYKKTYHTIYIKGKIIQHVPENLIVPE